MSNQEQDRQSTTEPPPIGLADASVFIGVTTMPMHQQAEFLARMRRFFENYRKGTASHLVARKGSSKGEEFRRCFYNPTLYVLLGTFDLAVLSLMEDYEFGAQTFNPFDPMWLRNEDRFGRLDPGKLNRLRSLEPMDFAHRLILGPRPSWQEKSEMPGLAGKSFLGWSRQAEGGSEFVPRQPLLGICQVEVNTGLLVGGGATFLDALVKAIRSEFRVFREGKEHKETELMILEGYSWHELTLLVFADSFQHIGDFIRQIRELRLIDVGAALCRKRDRRSPEEPDSYAREWRALLSQSNLYGLLRMPTKNPPPPPRLQEWLTNPDLITRFSRRRTLPNKTLAHLIRNPRGNRWIVSAKKCSRVRPFGTHVLFNTTTALGFWAGFLDSTLARGTAKSGIRAVAHRKHHPSPVCANDKQFYFIRRWNTKAGHERSVLEKLNGDEDIAVSPGRADFYYPCDPDEKLGFMKHSSAAVVEKMMEGYLSLRPRPRRQKVQPCFGGTAEPCGGAMSVNSTIAFKPDACGESRISRSHLSAYYLRKGMACSADVVVLVSRWLKQLRVPKVVVERVLNAIALYNDGILDNFLFSSFLELRPYLTRMVDFVRECASRSSQGKPENSVVVQKGINQLVDYLETGWRNRFYGGWRLGEVTDFNLEFKGGIQQLLSAFDGAYRMISWGFTNEERTLAIVTGEPGISVHSGALNLSFFDIFKPGFFAARVGHEASEQLLARDPVSFLDRTRMHPGWVQKLYDVERLAWVWLRMCEYGETAEGDLLRPVSRLEVAFRSPKADAVLQAALQVREMYDRRLKGWLDLLAIAKAKEPASLLLQSTENYASAVQGSTPPTRDQEQLLLMRIQRALIAYREGAVDPLQALCKREPRLKPFLDRDRKPERLFDQIFADICNFVIVFGGNDMDLYAYRSLGNFGASPDLWATPQHVDVSTLREALLRVFLTLCSGPEGRNPEADVWRQAEQVVLSYWTELQEYVDQDELGKDGLEVCRLIPDALELARRLRCTLRPDWFESAHSLASAPLGFEACCKERSEFESFVAGKKEYSRVALDRRFRRKDHADWVRADLGPDSKRYRNALRSLRKGEAYVAGGFRPALEDFAKERNGEKYPVELDHWFDFCDTVVVLRAYLSVLQQEAGVRRGLKNIVERDEEGNVTETDHSQHAYSRFDPRGGVFTTEPEYRRASFKLRAALAMSLLDLSEKSKLIYCWQKPDLLPRKKA